MIRGAGTILNVVTVLVGSGLGLLLGHRLPQHTRNVVTDALGLVTLLVAALSAAAVLDRPLIAAVGNGAPVLIVLGALLIGGIAGSLLRLEDRLEALGAWLQSRLGGAPNGSRPNDRTDEQRERFVQGFLTASLLFCVGPLAVLGPINDGLGRGIDQLALKSTLDGFAAIAFASSFGIGVAASVISIALLQGTFTVVGVALGDVLPASHVSALTATGGLLLVGIALRLLQVRMVPVGDLLPALLVAPLLTQLVVVLR